MSRTTDQALLIFTRNPVPGKCKTRLAATIGNDRALDVYRFLLRHTETVAKNLKGTDKTVYFTEHLGDGSFWDPAQFGYALQSGRDLGARMADAFASAFRLGYRKVVLIGSDLYDLSTADLEAAFTALETHPAVLGPAADGGYYLLGLTQMRPELFENKAWGTETVLQATLKNLQGTPVFQLPVRNDVDRYEDIAGNPVFAPFLNDISHD
ncbi:TIGR04282 family arsenosugar biosynthesis glycosyltransferase [Robiginitalea sp. M366]|uniref:TIGR04282 family arsenosugar biosynthesis glycosyltransferase n=1 Tax=Robiginitalea aestuariiviva TaxID=3036903 RepID=UPI00240E3D23|nr:TIGR04282 family arsenosugar biosynthesis glycosyltransferase [Robiginitalea aestuariiviva]MDG1571857.1 TIGR04282 family arsenosugar biosynthesis glycosyltransferase [Robiginitalea aestuariiviva]